MDTLTLFCKNLNQRSLTPRWPLTPYLLRSHVWLYPRIIVSKSHDNSSMYVDTVINFANYHIQTHPYIHIHTTYRMSDHIVSYWTQFRRDKNQIWSYKIEGPNFLNIKSNQYLFYIEWKEQNYLAKTLTGASIWFYRREHNTHSILIDCALGKVILAGTIKILPNLLTNQMTGIFRWGI